MRELVLVALPLRDSLHDFLNAAVIDEFDICSGSVGGLAGLQTLSCEKLILVGES